MFFNTILEVLMVIALDGCEIRGFADDMSLLADSEGELQNLLNTVHQTSSRFEMTISSPKTTFARTSKVQTDGHQVR